MNNMDSTKKNKVLELEAKIQILENENEFLSAKAEENLLLNRAFEGINLYEDIEMLFLNTLENISVLLEIQFSGIFDFKNNQFTCISSYALFNNEDTSDVYLKISEKVLSYLSVNRSCFLKFDDGDIDFRYPNSHFKPDNFLIIPLNLEIIKDRYFVFANGIDQNNLSERASLFDKIIRIISAKLDKIFYQNELKKLNTELEKIVEERTSELTRQNEEYVALNEEYKTLNEDLFVAKEKAEESDVLKSSFLANMSHEIRTPMNGILGFAGLLKEPDLSGELRNNYIRIIEKSGERMLNIINDIVDISKIESGLMEIFHSATNINEQIEYLMSFFKPEAERKGMQMICSNPLSVNDALFLTDREKLYAILTNLVKNAIKYTEKGIIEFGYLPLKDQEEAFLHFYVKDSGIGIARDRQDAIFERFIQADFGNTRAYQGAGLGLSISKAYVEMLGGKIWVESELGKGSAFYFTIPLIKEINLNGIDEQINSVQNRYKGSKGLKILIGEDDATSDILISIVLRDISREILHASSGFDIVEICKNNPDINLIMMDIQLIGLNGFDATMKIREFNKNVIIIAQTAFALTGDREKAIAAGCNDYIAKPIDAKALITLIEKHFS